MSINYRPITRKRHHRYRDRIRERIEAEFNPSVSFEEKMLALNSMASFAKQREEKAAQLIQQANELISQIAAQYQHAQALYYYSVRQSIASFNLANVASAERIWLLLREESLKEREHNMIVAYQKAMERLRNTN